jgi:integrase
MAVKNCKGVVFMTKEQIPAKLKADLELRGRSEETIKEYLTKARLFQVYYGKPADQMGEQEIIGYLHYLLTEKGNSQTSVNTYNSGLRFLYGVTLDRALNYKKLPRLKQIRSLPKLFTKDEVRRIIDSAGTLTHKALLMLAYGSGLRLSDAYVKHKLKFFLNIFLTLKKAQYPSLLTGSALPF